MRTEQSNTCAPGEQSSLEFYTIYYVHYTTHYSTIHYVHYTMHYGHYTMHYTIHYVHYKWAWSRPTMNKKGVSCFYQYSRKFTHTAIEIVTTTALLTINIFSD